MSGLLSGWKKDEVPTQKELRVALNKAGVKMTPARFLGLYHQSLPSLVAGKLTLDQLAQCCKEEYRNKHPNPSAAIKKAEAMSGKKAGGP